MQLKVCLIDIWFSYEGIVCVIVPYLMLSQFFKQVDTVGKSFKFIVSLLNKILKNTKKEKREFASWQVAGKMVV